MTKIVGSYRGDDLIGKVVNERGSVIKIGDKEGGVYPYDLLLGALASCYYSTFLDIAIEEDIEIKSCKVEVLGEKRDKSPTTLKWVNINLFINGTERVKKYKTIAKLACEYCSIYVTLSKVADIKVRVNIVD